MKMSKTVMVTGALGFLGMELSTSLRDRGHKVYSFDFQEGEDICDYEQFFAKLKESRASVVVHLAAISDIYTHQLRPERCDEINITGTRNVVKACNELGVRCLFASTCCAYGNNHTHPSTEDAPLCPGEPYAVSKKIGEAIIAPTAENRHTSLRLATFYGPTMRATLVQSVFLRLAHQGKPLKVHGDGNQTRTYTHVEDVVSGIVTVLESNKWYPVVNISTDVSYTVLDVADMCIEITGKTVPIQHTANRHGQIFREEICNERLRSMGWVPKWDMKDALPLVYQQMVESGSILRAPPKRIIMTDENKQSTGENDSEKFDPATPPRESRESFDPNTLASLAPMFAEANPKLIATGEGRQDL